MTLATDRATIVKQLYGDGLLGNLTSNILNLPANLASKNTKAEFNIDAANKLLDEGGYKRGGDGIRVTPGGVRMKVVFQTSINSLRQKEQAIIKDGWQKIGIETEIKSVDQGIYFSSDPANPDTASHFSTDIEMLSSAVDSPFPVGYMARFYPVRTTCGLGRTRGTIIPAGTTSSGRTTSSTSCGRRCWSSLTPRSRPGSGSRSTTSPSTITPSCRSSTDCSPAASPRC